MAKQTTNWGQIGHYAFFLGAILAIIAGLFTGLVSDTTVLTILVILGAIVGLLNVTVKETDKFLIATIALMLAGVVNLGLIPYVGVYLRSILTNIVVFVVPAAIIVGLKTVYSLAREM